MGGGEEVRYWVSEEKEVEQNNSSRSIACAPSITQKHATKKCTKAKVRPRRTDMGMSRPFTHKDPSSCSYLPVLHAFLARHPIEISEFTLNDAHTTQNLSAETMMKHDYAGRETREEGVGTARHAHKLVDTHVVKWQHARQKK